MTAEDLSGRRVVVTGGHGFIGLHVMRALAGVGAHPIGLFHPEVTVDSDAPGEAHAVDLEDPVATSAAIEGADHVVHLAARAGGIQFQLAEGSAVFTTNRRITDNVLLACVQRGIDRVFLASSSVVYRDSKEPFGENHAVLGITDRPLPYAWSKITDEVVAGWHSDVRAVVGRFGNVYGPGADFTPERATVIHALIDRAARLGDGEVMDVWGDGTAVRSFVFVEDVARAVVVVLAAGEIGTAYNIDSGRATTIAEVAGIVRDSVNPTLKLRFDAARPVGPHLRVPLVDRLGGLGFSTETDLETGVRRTVEWYRGHEGTFALSRG